VHYLSPFCILRNHYPIFINTILIYIWVDKLYEQQIRTMKVYGIKKSP
jgi:hypothetical protein